MNACSAPLTCSVYSREQNSILEFTLVVEKDNKHNEKLSYIVCYKVMNPKGRSKKKNGARKWRG